MYEKDWGGLEFRRLSNQQSERWIVEADDRTENSVIAWNWRD
jgi:hypothetical protein